MEGAVAPPLLAGGNSVAGKFAAELVETARRLAAPGKGILAADESTGTIGRRVRQRAHGSLLSCLMRDKQRTRPYNPIGVCFPPPFPKLSPSAGEHRRREH